MNYLLPLKYFFVMSALLLLSGLWMFILHTSLTIYGVLNYYESKSFLGLLEIVNPHLFSMGVFVFVLTHFFSIVKGVKQKKFVLFSIFFFITMLLLNLSVFFIFKGTLLIAFLKLFSTLLFLVFSCISYYFILKMD